jgi:hypothetical protein
MWKTILSYVSVSAKRGHYVTTIVFSFALAHLQKGLLCSRVKTRTQEEEERMETYIYSNNLRNKSQDSVYIYI